VGVGVGVVCGCGCGCGCGLRLRLRLWVWMWLRLRLWLWLWLWMLGRQLVVIARAVGLDGSGSDSTTSHKKQRVEEPVHVVHPFVARTLLAILARLSNRVPNQRNADAAVPAWDLLHYGNGFVSATRSEIPAWICTRKCVGIMMQWVSRPHNRAASLTSACVLCVCAQRDRRTAACIEPCS
jgi:hypothetical protein